MAPKDSSEEKASPTGGTGMGQVSGMSERKREPLKSAQLDMKDEDGVSKPQEQTAEKTDRGEKRGTKPLPPERVAREVRRRQRPDFNPLESRKAYTGPTVDGKPVLKDLPPRDATADRQNDKEPEKAAEEPSAEAPSETKVQASGATERVRLERSRLSSKSKSELINIILDLKTQVPERTGALAPGEHEGPINTAAIIEGEKTTSISRYRRLPENPTRSREDTVAITWRIVMKNVNSVHKPFGLEIIDDVFIGRTAVGIKPDLNLLDYGADRLGVSRQHAILRPTKKKLLLIDLGSTNGTFFNGKRLRAGETQQVGSNDIISFAGLRFSVRVVSKPG